MFRHLQFRSLSNRLRDMHGEDFDDGEVVILDEDEAIEMTDVLVNTQAALDDLVKKLNSADTIAFDVETTGINQMEDLLVGISLAVDGQTGYYIPVGHVDPNSPKGVRGGITPHGKIDLTSSGQPIQKSMFEDDGLDNQESVKQLDLQTVIEAIKPALTNPDIPKMAHNATFDLVFMRRYGIDVQPITYDTMIAEWVREPASRNLGLKNLVSDRLGKAMQEIEDLIGKGAKQISFARVPVDQAVSYATADTAMLHRLQPNLSGDFPTETTHKLYDEIEIPLIPIIADMEMKGVLIDVPYLDELSEELDERIYEVQQAAFDMAKDHGEFNLNSTQQLNEVLFETLGIPTQGLKKTKSGYYSLAASVMEDLASEHPIIDLILEYRHLSKLKSTYVDALPQLVNPSTNRIHTSYNQTGTVTGRFSSTDPNLQNIPIRTDEGRRIRKAFVADKGHLLLGADYSQIELRILAHFSEDEELSRAFVEGLDIHTSTAAAVYGVDMEDVTYEQRSFAKAVNFGLMYGMSAFRLARDNNMSRTEASEFVNAYFERFSGVKDYLEGSKDFAREHGYVETLFGRRRNFPELMNEGTNHITRNRLEREATNMPIQGTNADILKIAMINLDRALKDNGFKARMMLQVHDELVLEVPENELDEVVPLVTETMENAVELNVPVRADAKVGTNWYDMEDQ